MRSRSGLFCLWLGLLLGLASLLPAAPSTAAQPGLKLRSLGEGALRLTLAAPELAWRDGLPLLPDLEHTLDEASGLPLVLAPIRLPAPVTPTLIVLGAPARALPEVLPQGTPPLPAARVLRLLRLREATLAVIALAPVQWDGRRLTHRPHLELELRFEEAGPQQSLFSPAPALTSLLDGLALNTLAARDAEARELPATPAHSPVAPDLLLSVDGPGLVTLRGEELAAAGWPLDSLLMSSLRLSHRGERLSFETNTAVIDNLGAETIIRFAVPPGLSRYTTQPGFRLSIDPEAQALLAAAPTSAPFVFGALAHYNSAHPGPALDGAPGDHLYVAALSASAPEATLVFTLPTALPAETPLLLGMQLDGLTATGRVQLRLNDQPALLHAWAGATPQTISLTSTASLQVGPHRLSLTLLDGGPLLVDQGWLPTVQVGLRDVLHQIRVAPPTLQQAPDSALLDADLLIVTHPLFRPALDPLLALHRSQGRKVALVTTEQVYAAYGDGALDPEALRSFLADAQPRAVLLVGDGTWDFKNHLGYPARTFVPPYLERIDGRLGEASCDSCYVRWSTPDPADDLMPDAVIGRLSVETLDEARAVVAKVVAYATHPPRGAWRATHLLIADNAYERDGTPDKTVVPGQPTFDQAGDAVAAMLPPDERALPFYFDPRPQSASLPGRYADARTLRADLFAAWNRGAAVISYIGHSNYAQWAVTDEQAGVPYLYSYHDAPRLLNGGRLPVLLGMSCLSGLFQEPSRPTTDEGLLRKADGGAIAVLSSSGLGVAHGHDYLHKGVLGALLGSPRHSLGQAQLAGFAAVLTQAGCCADLVYTYQLLGDPLATVLPSSAPSRLYLPLLGR